MKKGNKKPSIADQDSNLQHSQITCICAQAGIKTTIISHTQKK